MAIDDQPEEDRKWQNGGEEEDEDDEEQYRLEEELANKIEEIRHTTQTKTTTPSNRKQQIDENANQEDQPTIWIILQKSPPWVIAQ